MRKIPNAIMLFAAGFGTRMGALTANCPKPLIKVAGMPLIDHALQIVDGTGLETVVANTHYLPGLMAAHLSGRDVTQIHETDILETGGGLQNALPVLGPDPVFTFNTDAVWAGENPLNLLAAAWNPEKMDALLLLIPPANARGYQGAGDFVLGDDGTIKRGPGMIYSGAQIIKTDGLADISETKFSMHMLWDKMYPKRRIFGVPYSGKWCDVGTPAGIDLAEEMLKVGNV